ncbi:MAG: phosphoadenosine phosphosulfate reductase family protein [Magnetococcales bacterium]|nr:phosphoadenosine phosphosulfate reductase family protein [Magnetococcales bacterium]
MIVRHVLGISGGKDSAALAIYLKEQGRVPEMEYFFTDTGAELQEVYDFVDRLEAYLGQEIVRLNSGSDFDHFLKVYGGFLPSARQRWCTRKMKLEPFERFVGDDPVTSYIGIRADEDRQGYLSHKPTIKAVFPFIEDGIVREDVFRILKETVGIPEYYQWRSRSGCYFCFFQRRDEWIGLHDRHPDLFRRAMEYEKFNEITGERYTWIQGLSLEELVENRSRITSKADCQTTRSWEKRLLEDDDEDQACLICSL